MEKSVESSPLRYTLQKAFLCYFVKHINHLYYFFYNNVDSENIGSIEGSINGAIRVITDKSKVIVSFFYILDQYEFS